MSRRNALSAVFWSTFELLLGHGSRFIFSVFLARLLMPEQFGIIAILSLFIGIASVVVESGFTPVLIQRQDINAADKSTVFWINILLGSLFAGVIFSLSGTISSYFELPVLEPLSKLMALNVVLTALGSVHRAILIKDVNFKPLMVLSVVSTLVSGSAAVALAMLGFGVWALAVQTMLGSFATTLLLWFVVSWHPGLIFSWSSVKRLSTFGGYLLASAILEVLYTRLYSLLIGKLYGPRELGFYSRAETTTALPVTITSSVLARVAFPMFSASSGDRQLLKSDMRLAVQAAMLVNTPAMLGLAVVADAYVVTLFGEAWRPSVPIVQILCLGGLLMPLHILNVQALMATGNGSLLLRLEVVKKIIGIGVIIISSSFGIYGMAWGVALASLLALFANVWFSGRVLDYHLPDQLRDSLPALVLGAAMSLAVLFLSREMSGATAVGRLMAEVALGLLVYAAGVALWQPAAYKLVKARAFGAGRFDV